MSRTNGTAQPAPAEAIAAMIGVTLTPIVAPLVAELTASRQTVERSQARVAELERENGELRAENRAHWPPRRSLLAEPTTGGHSPLGVGGGRCGHSGRRRPS